MATETIWYPEEHTLDMAAVLQEGLNAVPVPEPLAEILSEQIEGMVAYAGHMQFGRLSERHPREQKIPTEPTIRDIIRRKAEEGNGPDWKDYQ